MSVDSSPPDDRLESEPESELEEAGAARIADPDQYNHRRRIQQLHNVKEHVTEISRRTTLVDVTNRDFTPEQKHELVAEAAADYIGELVPVLQEQDLADDFLDRELAPVDGATITIRDFAEARGRLVPELDRDNPLLRTSAGVIAERRTPPYEVSRMAASVCDSYFNRIAGAEYSVPDAVETEPF